MQPMGPERWHRAGVEVIEITEAVLTEIPEPEEKSHEVPMMS